MNNRKLPAFTILETLIALGVTGLLFVTIQLLLPCFRVSHEPPLDMALRAAIYQITTQKYALKGILPHELQLISHDGKKMTLSIVKNRLQLSGEGAGQVIFISEVTAFHVKDYAAYVQLELSGPQHQQATEVLYLPRAQMGD